MPIPTMSTSMLDAKREPRAPQVIVLANDRQPRRAGEVVVVPTPLDLITALEREVSPRVVVISGSFARDRAIAGFVRDNYPNVGVAVGEVVTSPRW